MRNSTLILLGILLFQCCNISKGDKEVIVQVDKEFSIDPYELLGNNRQLVFDIKSIENQPCLNSTIDENIIKQIDKLSLYINGIEPATDCNPGEASATVAANAGVIQNKSYDFLISLRNALENEGNLTVSDESYHFSLLSNDGITLVHNILYKIPQNFIWGYVASNNLAEGEPALSSLKQDISQITQSKFLNKGYYGQFSIDNQQELSLTNPPSFQNVNTFFYKFIGEQGQLEDILENHRATTSGQDIELVIFTSEGKTL